MPPAGIETGKFQGGVTRTVPLAFQWISFMVHFFDAAEVIFGKIDRFRNFRIAFEMVFPPSAIMTPISSPLRSRIFWAHCAGVGTALQHWWRSRASHVLWRHSTLHRYGSNRPLNSDRGLCMEGRVDADSASDWLHGFLCRRSQEESADRSVFPSWRRCSWPTPDFGARKNRYRIHFQKELLDRHWGMEQTILRASRQQADLIPFVAGAGQRDQSELSIRGAWFEAKGMAKKVFGTCIFIQSSDQVGDRALEIFFASQWDSREAYLSVSF